MSNTARSIGEWNPLMTTLLVWAISCAQRVASSSASGGALREAKKATKGLSKSSVFPDKSIKKAQATASTYPAPRSWLPVKRISNTDSPRRRYIAHTEPIGGKDIHQTRTSDCASSCYSKRPSFDMEDYDNKMSTNMYGIETEVVSRNKDKQNF